MDLEDLSSTQLAVDERAITFLDHHDVVRFCQSDFFKHHCAQKAKGSARL